MGTTWHNQSARIIGSESVRNELGAILTSVTIGIPSYRRVLALGQLLVSIADTTPAGTVVPVIVVNDSGTSDDLLAYRASIAESPISSWIRLVEHEANKGYPISFQRMFAECQTEYLFLVADDDTIDLSGLGGLVNFLEEVGPDICSTQYLRDDKVYRGRAQSRRARPSEFRKVNGHAPGVLYNVERCKNSLSQLSVELERGNVAAYTYPQLLLTIDLMLHSDNCWFFAGAFVEEGAAMISGITDASGTHYADLTSRIQQLAAFDRFIASYPISPERDEMLRASREFFISKCLRADPSLLSDVIAAHGGGLRTQLRRALSRRIANFIRKLV